MLYLKVKTNASQAKDFAICFHDKLTTNFAFLRRIPGSGLLSKRIMIFFKKIEKTGKKTMFSGNILENKVDHILEAN